ncbi:putative LOB domain-containing protein 36 [Iris pallida]|uniref:LOB domain-containing protein 36 n=1 Tax=Iris pallida TaxID=29817 RepID=A0AAX6EZJ1_IRIPA|nr:putative LOB domain-containing protein 36 [Iris pallida]KAJ6845066.1 putative LOB domain-containing protein 36 [Iris pallida]KAJ6845067.1 putative LOB domain-containing protein 36 [Iris pallida]KAJ6852969.1 putative LOB domain-containing protein 36 [Iris pallida]
MTSSSSPCAACKFLQCNCTQGCVFAPYFPSDQPRFSNVFRVFGASNVAMMLNWVCPEHRKDMANYLAYMSLIDPVQGCFREIELLEGLKQNLQILEIQKRTFDYLNRLLAVVRALVDDDDDAAVPLGHVFTPPHHPQQQEEDYNYLVPASSSASQRQMLMQTSGVQIGNTSDADEPTIIASDAPDSDEPTTTASSSSLGHQSCCFELLMSTNCTHRQKGERK